MAVNNNPNTTPIAFVYPAVSPASHIEASLIQAYLDTVYWVDAQVPVALRIGQFSHALSEFCESHKYTSATFVTSENPFSHRQTKSQNAVLRQQFVEELNRCQLKFLTGVSRHPSGDWPEEHSFLVLDLTVEEAVNLGKTWSRNAIVYADRQWIPSLILLV